MPNADAKHNSQELLWQIESEVRQIGAQIDSINLTLKPWRDELAALKDYRQQLLDLYESIQRRTKKPRVVTIERKTTTKVSLDPSTKSLLDVLKNMSAADLAALCRQIDEQNGENQNENQNICFTISDDETEG